MGGGTAMVQATPGGADPFGTARLRRGVLDAWAASPARFREDANAEEDLALGGYRDRLVVELAQNAADAAARAGVPGRLRLTFAPTGPTGSPHTGPTGPIGSAPTGSAANGPTGSALAAGGGPATLIASNTGAPLDAPGVESLSTLRASAKRDDDPVAAVGRFGVGFAAVLAVSDEPAVVGRAGGVRWSLAEARELAREAAGAARAAEAGGAAARAAGAADTAGAGPGEGLADELRRRDGHVPLLRLPLPAEGTAPVGYDTAVVLPLRDGAAADLVARLLAGIDDALLLTLPGLDEVVVETPESVRTLTRHQEGLYVVIEDREEHTVSGAAPRPDTAPRPHTAPRPDTAPQSDTTLRSDTAPGSDAARWPASAPLSASAPGAASAPVTRTTRWRTSAAGGALDAALLADRPVEERLRPVWSVTWAVPVRGDEPLPGHGSEFRPVRGGEVPPVRDSEGERDGGDRRGAPARPATAPVVHAPTPTDEPLDLPALLIASFPLEPTRRHAAPGPLTDFLVERAAEAYVALVRDWRPVGTGTIDLVPGPLGKGELDGRLRAAILRDLPQVPFLPSAVPPAASSGDERGAEPREPWASGDAQAAPGVGSTVPGMSGSDAVERPEGTPPAAWGERPASSGDAVRGGESTEPGAGEPTGAGAPGAAWAASPLAAPGGPATRAHGEGASSAAWGELPAPAGAVGAAARSRPSGALRPLDAELVEGAGADTVRVLGELFPQLLPAGLERRGELRALGVARVPLGEAIDRLAGVERDPAWWRRLYDSLSGVDPDRLSGLPVPLADGRTTIGPRQVLLPLPDDGQGLGEPVLPGAPATADTSRTPAPTAAAAEDGDDRHPGRPAAHAATLAREPGPSAPHAATLARLGLKVAHPDAVHPLLERLGATPATPRAVLTTPQVRAAVAGSLDIGEIWDEDADALDAEELAEAVLGLVRDARLEPGDEPWLAALALPDDEGEPAPAGELVLPGSVFEQVVREGELGTCDAELAERWGAQPLTAVGVLADFALVRATDVVLDPDELDPREGDFAEPDDIGLCDAVDVWCEDVLDRLPDTPVPPVATEVIAVRDLDLVDDDAWPQALALLARPPLRDALTRNVRVLLPDGTTETVRPYAAWWLRGQPVLGGRHPAGLRAAGGDPLLTGLYEPADAQGFDDEPVLRALGVRTSVAALLDEPGGAAELLSRLADPDRTVEPAQLHAIYGQLAELEPEQVTLPDELRAVVDGEVRVVDATDALVADTPDLLPLAAGRALLPVSPRRAADLAELLQVRRLSEACEGRITSGEPGETYEVPDPVRTLLGPSTPATYVEYEELAVDGVEADWRRTPDGVVHAATVEGVAAGLAWAADQWPRRFEVAALLEDPSRTGELARDRWFDQ